MAKDANYPFAYSKYSGQLVEKKVGLLNFPSSKAEYPDLFLKLCRCVL